MSVCESIICKFGEHWKKTKCKVFEVFNLPKTILDVLEYVNIVSHSTMIATPFRGMVEGSTLRSPASLDSKTDKDIMLCC